MGKKFLFLFVIVLFSILLILPYGIGQSMLKNFPERIKYLKSYGIDINFKNIKSPFCFFCIQFQIEEGIVNVLNQTISLGDIQVKIPIHDYHSIYFKNQTEKIENYLLIDGCFNQNVIDVYHSNFVFNNLEATLSGRVDLNNKMVLLKGEAVNLKKFIGQFIPDSLSNFLFLLFKDSSMNVEIDSKDSFLRINKIPIFRFQ